jgi:adenine-specific DNA-methyltransferase
MKDFTLMAPGRFQDQPKDKLRGGYYTPPEIAAWLARWAVRSKNDQVLEPSSGDGVFLMAVAVRLLELGATPQEAARQLRGVELETAEADKASHNLKQVLGFNPNGSIVCGDFFTWLETIGEQKFDCALGNPPFIRYQNFSEPSRSRAMALLSRIGLQPNKLTNTWVPFLVGAAVALKDGGRLAFVLPAELLQVSYAAQLRCFLAAHFHQLHLFACNHLVFSRAEQETLLLLADGYSQAPVAECLIEMVQTNSLSELLDARPNHKECSEFSILDHASEKWLKYFLTPGEIGLMRALKGHRGLARLGHHAQIDVGVVTGRNEFFVVSKPVIESFDLGEYAIPLIGRSSQLKGAILDTREWQGLAEAGQEVYLLDFPDQGRPLNLWARRYIALGQKKGFHRGYKCSIRQPWYAVPSVWVPECFFFRQIYDFPRVVLNRAKAVSTDTVHRMRCQRNPAAVLENVYTHLTAASAEIEGRSYGGGVLELEPTEAERLLLPKELRQGVPVEEVDRLVRAGKLAEVLKENDRLILQEVGLSATECATLRQIWEKMHQRRRSRKRQPK